MRETFAHLVLTDLQGKGFVWQRSISADSLYSLVVLFSIGVHEVAALSIGYFCGHKRTRSLAAMSENDYLDLQYIS